MKNKNTLWLALLPTAILLVAAVATNKYVGQFTGTFYGNGAGLTNVAGATSTNLLTATNLWTGSNTFTGTVTAGAIAGNGSNLTNLTAIPWWHGSKGRLFFLGDSESAYGPGDEVEWPRLITNRPPFSEFTYGTNVAYSGATLSNTWTQWTNYLAPFSPTTNDAVFLWAGANNQGSGGALATASFQGSYSNLCVSIKTNGCTLTVIDILPSVFGPETNSACSAARGSFNAWLRGLNSNWDFCITAAKQFPDCYSTVDYADGVHLTSYAKSRLANAIIGEWIAGPGRPQATPSTIQVPYAGASFVQSNQAVFKISLAGGAASVLPTDPLIGWAEFLNMESPLGSIRTLREPLYLSSSAPWRTLDNASGDWGVTTSTYDYFYFDTTTSTTGRRGGYGSLALPTANCVYAMGGAYYLTAACDGTETYWAMFGTHSIGTTSTPQTGSGAYFIYDMYNTTSHGLVGDVNGSATNHWICVINKANTFSAYDSGLTPSVSASAPDRLAVVITTTSVTFWTNSVPCVTYTGANIPAVNLWLDCAKITKTAGSTSRKLMEAFPMQYIRNATAAPVP